MDTRMTTTLLPKTAADSAEDRMEGGVTGGHPGRRILRCGSWKKPEIRLVRSDGLLAVQKDYRRPAALLRPWFRWAWHHEERIYRALQGAGNSPRLVRAEGGLLELEYVDGERISRLDPSRSGSLAVCALEASVQQIHKKGVYHLDLRKRDNILVTPDGQVHLLDFGSAVFLRPDGWLRRLLGPLLEFFDRYAVLKWKARLDPAALTAADRRLLRRLDRLRGRRRQSDRIP